MKIGLGTAQLGLNYGISNITGKPTPSAAKEILAQAYRMGIRLIDTAPAYENSETIIGNFTNRSRDFDLHVVTKTPVLENDLPLNSQLRKLEETFFCSFTALKQKSIYGLLVHNAEDLLKPTGNKIINLIEEFKKAGYVEKIGVSVYSAYQIDRVMSSYNLDIYQVPVNVFDQRLICSGHLQKMKEKGIEVHARSIFLQGLLLMDIEAIPDCFDRERSNIKKYHDYIKKMGWSKLEAALQFILNCKYVDNIIIGVNRAVELEEIIKVAKNKPAVADFSGYALEDEAILNPAKWKL